MGETASPHVVDADFEEVANQRRADRRGADRRAVQPRFEPLFVATLVNHVAPREKPAARAYPAPAAVLRNGIVVNLRV